MNYPNFLEFLGIYTHGLHISISSQSELETEGFVTLPQPRAVLQERREWQSLTDIIRYGWARLGLAGLTGLRIYWPQREILTDMQTAGTEDGRARQGLAEAGYDCDILYFVWIRSEVHSWMNKTDPAQSDVNGHNERPGMRSSAGLNRCQIGIRCTRPFLVFRSNTSEGVRALVWSGLPAAQRGSAVMNTETLLLPDEQICLTIASYQPLYLSPRVPGNVSSLVICIL